MERARRLCIPKGKLVLLWAGDFKVRQRQKLLSAQRVLRATAAYATIPTKAALVTDLF